MPTDPILSPMYQHDLAGAEWRLREFLVGRFGGPTRYIEQRGHPRLRMRHQPFSIGRAERDAWMRHMREAIDAVELPAPVREAFLEYFENAATAMMNRGGPPF